MKAQSSLEQLIVIAAFFGMFSALLPAMNQSYQAALFWVEVNQAQQSLQALKQAVDATELMAPESRLSVTMRSSSDWLVESDGRSLRLTVKNNSIPKTKTLEEILSTPIQPFQKTFRGKTEWVVQKTSGGTLVQ